MDLQSGIIFISFGDNTFEGQNLDQQEFFWEDLHNFLPSRDEGCHFVGSPPEHWSEEFVIQCFALNLLQQLVEIWIFESNKEEEGESKSWHRQLPQLLPLSKVFRAGEDQHCHSVTSHLWWGYIRHPWVILFWKFQQYWSYLLMNLEKRDYNFWTVKNASIGRDMFDIYTWY